MDINWAEAITIAGVGFATVVCVLAILAVVLFVAASVTRRIAARDVGSTTREGKEVR